MFRGIFIILALSPAVLAQERVTYDDDVLPIFQQACLNCHNPDKTKGGLDLSSFSAAMKGGSGGKVAEAGDTSSKLIACVEQTAEPKMPPEGEKLAAGKIAVLRKWIEGGLLENKSSSARKPAKPKFDTALRSDPAGQADGPPPMPDHLLLEPPVVTSRAGAVRAVAASPRAPLIAITSQRQVVLHHAETLELVGILPFPEGDPVSLAFTPDGRHLIVGGGIPGKSGTTVTFDITHGTRILEVGREFDSVLAADVRPSFDLVATGGPSRLMKLWNSETGSQITAVKKHTDWITAMDFSPDGVLLASGDRNGGVWVWESSTGSEFHTLRGHQAGITATCFRADSNLLATASEDGTVRFWEMNGGSEVRKIDAHPGGVTAFAFAPDGSSITTGRNLKARLWKPDFTPARELSAKLPAPPTAAALDVSAARAFIGGSDGIVRVIRTQDATPIGEIASNPPSIRARLVALSETLRQKQETLDAQRAGADQCQSALVAARQSLDQARGALAQAEEIHKAAAAATPADETAARLAAEAASRLEAKKQAIPALESALAAATEAHRKATTTTEQADKEAVTVRQAIHRWTGAIVHTRLNDCLRRSAEFEESTAQQQAGFLDAANSVAECAAVLNGKRAELLKLDPSLMKSSTGPLREELLATRAAVQIRLEQETRRLHEAEEALIAARTTLQQTAAVTQQSREESTALQSAYAQFPQ